jgi:probable O-glycosylation ligase (exosortase A-associated)
MRDYLILATILATLPLILYRPWVGALAWAWISYMNPHRLAWGVVYQFPAAQLVALATLASVALGVLRGRVKLSIPWERESILLALLWLLWTATSFFAIHTDWAWEQWGMMTKILLMTFLTIVLIDDMKKLRYLLLVIVFSLGFYGVKGGIFSVLSGGAHRVWGPEYSFIGDNNSLALALNMILPFLVYMSTIESNKKIKWALRIAIPLTVLAIIFTYSRGGFLGLVVVTLLIVWRAKTRTKLIAVLIAALALPVAIGFIPDQWFDRIGTLKEYDEDASARGRFEAWKVAWGVALDRPLTGGGFDAINDKELYSLYNPESPTDTGVHSVYFEVLGENGFVTFGVFLALIVAAALSLQKIAKSGRGQPELRTFWAYAAMLHASLLAFAVCGTFLELASFDLFYNVIAMVVIVKVLFKREVELNLEKTETEVQDDVPAKPTEVGVNA